MMDLVDRIDAVGRLARRHPFLCIAVTTEAVLLVAALGWMPGPFGLVLGPPAYVVHALGTMAVGTASIPAPVALLGLAMTLDWAWRGLCHLATR